MGVHSKYFPLVLSVRRGPYLPEVPGVEGGRPGDTSSEGRQTRVPHEPRVELHALRTEPGLGRRDHLSANNQRGGYGSM